MFQKTRNSVLAFWLVFHCSLSFCNEDIIYRDVAIIDGGAVGTFSAMKLHDQGKSVILIEKEGMLGGHTNTYRDPVTQQTAEYGVQVFRNQQVVLDFFDRLKVS